MILVDSSVWISYFNGTQTWQAETLDHLLQNNLLITGDLIVTEVLQGFRKDKDFLLAKEALEILPFFNLGGREVAIESANNYRLLRKKGITVRKTIDMIIGTFCALNKHTLLHNDRDFDNFASYIGLQVISKANA